MMQILLSSLLAVLLACGGGQKTGDDIGETHSGSGSDDLDTDNGGGSETGPAGEEGTSGEGETEAPPASPYTIVVNNTADTDLAFNMDMGWAASISMYSGKPPKAVVVLPFAKHCTESCDADPESICPSCPQPEKLKDIRQVQKLETVKAGASLEIPWDGQVHIYEKVKGKKRCECYKREPVPDATYTIKVCGLRLTKSEEASTELQCIDGQLIAPSSEPQRVELEFPKPPKKKRK
jgi:hypothetical protein